MPGSVVPLIMFLYQHMGGFFSMWESMKASEKIHTHRNFVGILWFSSWFQLICIWIIDCQNSHLSGMDLDICIYPSIALLYFSRSFIPYWCLPFALLWVPCQTSWCTCNVAAFSTTRIFDVLVHCLLVDLQIAFLCCHVITLCTFESDSPVFVVGVQF